MHVSKGVTTFVKVAGTHRGALQNILYICSYIYLYVVSYTTYIIYIYICILLNCIFTTILHHRFISMNEGKYIILFSMVIINQQLIARL